MGRSELANAPLGGILAGSGKPPCFPVWWRRRIAARSQPPQQDSCLLAADEPTYLRRPLQRGVGELEPVRPGGKNRRKKAPKNSSSSSSSRWSWSGSMVGGMLGPPRRPAPNTNSAGGPRWIIRGRRPAVKPRRAADPGRCPPSVGPRRRRIRPIDSRSPGRRVERIRPVDSDGRLGHPTPATSTQRVPDRRAAGGRRGAVIAGRAGPARGAGDPGEPDR